MNKTIVSILILGASVFGHSQNAPTPTCTKNISFAWAESGTTTPYTPEWLVKWVAKNQSKTPGTCFSQYPLRNMKNYLIVLSKAASDTVGVQPVTSHSTDITTAPISGSGTLTSYSGITWNYTYSGTITTTTRTTTTQNVSYTRESSTLFMNAYDDAGYPVDSQSSTVSSQQGGDPSYSLGYNLTSLLLSIHWKENLLKQVVKNISKDCLHELGPSARCALSSVQHQADLGTSNSNPAETTGLPDCPSPDSDHRLRAFSGGVLEYCGSDGYCLSVEETKRCFK